MGPGTIVHIQTRDHGTLFTVEEVQMERRRKIGELKGVADRWCVNWDMELTRNWVLCVPFM